jgi:hypothetical protein
MICNAAMQVLVAEPATWHCYSIALQTVHEVGWYWEVSFAKEGGAELEVVGMRVYMDGTLARIERVTN